MCLSMVRLKACPFGDQCEFAHSYKELKYYQPKEWVDLVKSMNTVHFIREGKNNFSGETKQMGMQSLMEACQIDDFQGAA